MTNGIRREEHAQAEPSRPEDARCIAQHGGGGGWAPFGRFRFRDINQRVDPGIKWISC